MKATRQAGSILIRWETILLVLLVLVITVNSVISPYFLNVGNILFSTFNFTEQAIMALPMMLVIIGGDIDISVASILGLTSVFMGMASSAGAPTEVIVLVGLAAGGALGLLNGLIIAGLGIPSIAVTLGGLSLYRGLAYVILGNGVYTNYPPRFAFFGQGYVDRSGAVPFELVLFAALAVVFGVVLHLTTYGRKLFAIGSNPVTARFSGIPVNRIRTINFTLNGLAAGLASVLLTSRVGSTRPDIASGWELTVITIVVLGGVSIYGGEGNIVGVVIAVFLLGFARFGLALVNVPGQVADIVTGFLLIVAVLLPGALGRYRARRLVRLEGRSPTS
jgi:rhamnose transport system permease protein